MEVFAPIPSASLPLSARVPGKCILFGEHAVVHGQPELLFAVDLYLQIGARASPTTRLNGDGEALSHNAYLRAAIDRLWNERPPVEISSVSRIPRSAGLGSSAAFVAGLGVTLGAATGGLSRAQLAQTSFAIERGAQGVGSPGDTSAVVAGGFLTVNSAEGDPLWEVSEGGQQWRVRRVNDPGWIWVLAYTGVPRSTGTAVRAVADRIAEPGGPRLLEEFGTVASEGIAAVKREERSEVGRLMLQNQELLRQAGVTHPRLEALLEAAAATSEGAKITGAGAGGSIVALPKIGRELETARRLARAGGVPYIVRVAPDGARLVSSGPS